MPDDVRTRWCGKAALVTGATSGIGRATAFALGAAGLKVAVTGRRENRLREVAASLTAMGVETLALQVDQTTPSANERLFDEIRRCWGGVDVLVNNAGTHGGNGFLDTNPAQFDRCMSLNLDAAAVCLREAAHDMRRRPFGAIIVVSSLTAHRLVPGQTPPIYAASKIALKTIVDGMRTELARDASSVKVAMISPGLVASEFHAGRAPSRSSAPALLPDDVASAAMYILAAPPHVQVCDVVLRPIGQAD
jgi:NADP+-dependent farnesol dehydrogenase